MKKKVTYVHCGFQRPTEKGYEYHQAWIPKKFAELERILDFGKKRESKGWKVISVGDLERSHDDTVKLSERHKKGFLSIR